MNDNRPDVLDEHVLDAIHAMAVCFEGLESDRSSALDFLRNGDPSALRSRSDLSLLTDLKAGWEFILSHESDTIPFDHDLLSLVNSRLVGSASIWPGTIRTRYRKMTVHLAGGGRFDPGMPDIGAMDSAMSSLGTVRTAHGMAETFAVIARNQPFTDGNKRTAVLAVDWFAVRNGLPLLSIPSDFDGVDTFDSLLSRWYTDGDRSFVAWLGDRTQGGSAAW